MWVILAKNSQNEIREDILSEILDIEKKFEPEIFLRKRGLRYQVTNGLSDALVYKQKSSCEKLLKRFNSSNKNNYYNNVFVWIKDYVLTYRKITKSEWDKCCDDELSIATIHFQAIKNKIEKKRSQIK